MDTTTDLKIGDSVRVVRYYPGQQDAVTLKTVVVIRVLKTGVVTSDGKRWRRDGILSGAQPERGIGFGFAPRIVKG